MVWLYVFYDLFIMGEMDYDLFSTNFTQWLLNTTSSLVLTIILYGTGPLLYYKMFQYPISKKELRKLSILYTVLAWLLGNLFIVFILGGEVPRSGAALVWGTIFYRTLTNSLKKTGRLETPGSESGYWIPEPLKLIQKAPAEKEEKVEPSSFYESERAAEQQSQKFGPLNPPKKRNPLNKAFLLRALTIVLICCLGGLSVYGAHKTLVLTNQLDEANEWEQKYKSLKTEYDSLLIELTTMESEYNQMKSDDKDADWVKYASSIYVGIEVEGDTQYYHTFLCDKILKNDGKTFWIWPTKALNEIGMRPCLAYHTSEEIDAIFAEMS